MSTHFTHGCALLIGVGQTEYALWSLPVTVKDAQAIRAVLTDPELCAYPNDAAHIRLLHDSSATTSAIRDGLIWLAAQAGADPEATVVVYYSGHGWLDRTTNRYYLIPHNTEPFNIPGSALPAEDFINILRQIPAKRLLILLDCCHAAGMATAKDPMEGETIPRLPSGFDSAPAPKAITDALKQGAGRAVFMSCKENQQSWIRADRTLSVYTYHLLEALQGAGNKPGEAEVRLSNLMNHLGKAVPASARQLLVEQTPFFDTAAEDFAIAMLRGGKGLLAGGWGATHALGTLLVDKTRDFVGRTYVFKKIEQFLVSQSNGYFVIKGDPGMGKSAFLAKYVRRTGCIAHFNIRALGITSAPQFLENVCSQLIADFGLPYPNITNVTQDGAFLSKLLKEASEKLASGERLVIAVDALDEVDLASHSAGANILYLPATLPRSVYFIMTQRRTDVPLVVQAPQMVLDLMAHSVENNDDVKVYIQRKTEHPKLRAWIDRQDLSIPTFVQTLANLSENNFMYLYYVLPEIEDGTYQNLDIQKLPLGLKGYYEDHWRQMGMMAKPLPRVKIRIVYIMCEVRQPVSRKLIAQFANDRTTSVDELTVQEVLDEWEQFLHKQLAPDAMRYSVYHTSFRDFLHRKDIVQAAGVTIAEINERIADSFLQELFDDD